MSPPLKPNAKIDWNAVRERLREDEVRLQSLLNPDEKQIQRVLESRAKVLRLEQQEAATHVGSVKCLLVVAGGERMALELAHISGVDEISNLVSVPGAPSQVMGMANVSGTLRAVLNPQALLRNIEGLAAQSPRWGVVLRHVHLQVMLGVDELLQIIPVPKTEVDESGIVMLDGQMTVFIELETVLTELEEKSRHRNDIISHD